MKPLTNAVREYIDAARVCRIASTRADGAPHVIPVCPVFDGSATLYVDLGESSVTVRAIDHNARVTVLIDDYDEDWTRLRKVILRCRARAADAEEQARAWEMIRAKYPQYSTVDWKPRRTVALDIEGWLQEGVG